MNKIIANIIAAGLLLLMLGLAFFSIRGDANTMDELAHTPAGYSYIIQKDMRLNPEHPPLLKDLAGLSVWLGSKITGTKINFPDQIKSWTEEVNGQWEFGRQFLFKSGNPADKIILWARLPMLLIMLLLGFYVFKWARELYDHKTGLLALFLYALSPTFIAHGRLVTTDVGAAAAFFIAAYYLIKWLQQSNNRNLIIAGLVFGLALLTKFSLVLIIPYFIFLAFVWGIINKKLFKTIFGLALIGLIALALVWPVYLYHTWNYPAERQLADAQHNLATYGNRLLADPVIWLSTKEILRPYGQFFAGLLMVIQRASGGNTTYFLGEVSNAAWPHYFPIVFLIKVPLALLILILIALIYSFFQIKKQPKKEFIQWLKKYFAELALLIFFAFYWIISIRSNLNIGVRHILPTFPILYVLISGQIIKWLKMSNLKYLVIIILLIWYAWGTIKIYPCFLTYFNELVGGPSNGYKYVTDSNLDWGQDLKRLAQYLQEKNIPQIYVDYFGGDDLEYRLGEKYQPWWGNRDPQELPADSWLAVSATFLQGGRGLNTKGYQAKTDFYNWLNDYEPVKVIGNSIFIYNKPFPQSLNQGIPNH
ncbi:MAG: glycosyltransferase family 39 protein [Patescibacteria group bacterium]